MSRWRAAAIHLGISTLIAGLVFAVIYFVWYPGALFDGAGGRELFLLIALVDLTIGPLITAIIFRSGKRGLKLDLAIIAVLQVAALSYGTWVLFQSRPVWIVFVKDRFELTRANQVLDDELAKAAAPFNEISLTGPRVAGVRLPTDPAEQMRIALSGAKGQDINTYPQYLVPYDGVRAEVKAKARAVEQLIEFNPQERARIDGLAAFAGRKAGDVGFLPMRADKNDVAALVDRTSGEFLGTVRLKPWVYE